MFGQGGIFKLSLCFKTIRGRCDFHKSNLPLFKTIYLSTAYAPLILNLLYYFSSGVVVGTLILTVIGLPFFPSEDTGVILIPVPS